MIRKIRMGKRKTEKIRKSLNRFFQENVMEAREA